MALIPSFVYTLAIRLQEAASGAASGSAPATGTGGAATPSPFDNILVPLGIGVVLFYFVAIRPASREKKVRATMMAGMKKGDRILLNCGLVGQLAALSEREVWVKVDDKNPLRLRFQKSSVQMVLESEEPAAPEPVEVEAK